MSTLGKLFGRSPFGPLREHMMVVKKCIDELIPFIEAQINEKDYIAQEIAQKIFELEDDADKIKNELRDNLPRSIFLPVDRSNLLEILDIQDSIADTAQDITILFSLRPLTVPEQIAEDLREHVDSSVKICYIAAEIADRFERLLKSSFSGTEAEEVFAMVHKLNDLERENDDSGLDLTRRIFRMEGTLSPVEIYLWSRTIRKIGDLADYSQKMANRMRLLLAK